MSDKEIAGRLQEPFAPDEVRWKPQAVKGDRALAIAYIDARCVQDRLDEVLGPGGWSCRFEVLPSGSVVCTLRVRINGEWVEKSDVGSESEQPDDGDKTKAAFSDSMKRAAVQLGIGRYLYRLPHQWVGYDPQKRQFSQTPRLPDWACPQHKPTEAQREILDLFQKVGKAASLPAGEVWKKIRIDLETEGKPTADNATIRTLDPEQCEIALGFLRSWLTRLNNGAKPNA